MSVLSCVLSFVFFKQKTAYEMRISDGSSDVCSSDLVLKGTRLSGKDSRYIRRLWQYAETAASLTVQTGGAEGVRDRRRAVPDKESALKQESQPLCSRTRVAFDRRSEEHTTELQSLMHISSAVFRLT